MTQPLAPNPTEATPESFHWLMNNFVTGTDGVAHALAVSADGIKLCASEALPLSSADQFAAITSGLSSLTMGAAHCFGEKTVERVMIEMGNSFLLIAHITHGAVLGVIAQKGADIGAIAYSMTVFSERAGAVLSPVLIDQLKNSLTV
jgi:predicted regulator of Ras-like GTPase activity (Roadblock/LC7/MglB family)